MFSKKVSASAYLPSAADDEIQVLENWQIFRRVFHVAVTEFNSTLPGPIFRRLLGWKKENNYKSSKNAN